MTSELGLEGQGEFGGEGMEKEEEREKWDHGQRRCPTEGAACRVSAQQEEQKACLQVAKQNSRPKRTTGAKLQDPQVERRSAKEPC